MANYLIIGCGHFGSRAVLRLLKRDRHVKITVIDRDKAHLEKVFHLPVQTIVSDGRSYLTQFLSQPRDVEYIIPAVPYHLVFEYTLCTLRSVGAKRTEVPPLESLPNPLRGKKGDLYTSFADFLCPEDCLEPPRYCTVTRKKRHASLFEILAKVKGAFHSKVIRSRQLGMGVGGFRVTDLLDLIEEIKKERDLAGPYLISTACRCHGVTSALTFD